MASIGDQITKQYPKSDIIAYALSGHKEDRTQNFRSVEDVISAYSEKHRAAILVHSDLTAESPSENLTEFPLGRFFIVLAAVTVLGTIALLCYWLVSGT